MKMAILFEGKQGTELPFPCSDDLLALEDCGGHAIPVQRPTPQAARAAMAALQQAAPQLECDPEQFLCLRLGRAEYMVCMARQALAPDRADNLLKQKTVLGAVATRAIGDDSYRIDHMLLAEPVAGLACSVHVLVQHRSGELAMAGWGELAAGQLLFHLHAVNRPGAVPAAIAGCLGGGRLEITHAAARLPGERH
jgi:hypothetical protein